MKYKQTQMVNTCTIINGKLFTSATTRFSTSIGKKYLVIMVKRIECNTYNNSTHAVLMREVILNVFYTHECAVALLQFDTVDLQAKI